MRTSAKFGRCMYIRRPSSAREGSSRACPPARGEAGNGGVGSSLVGRVHDSTPCPPPAGRGERKGPTFEPHRFVDRPPLPPQPRNRHRLDEACPLSAGSWDEVWKVLSDDPPCL